MMIYAYTRVSTDEQSVKQQVTEIEAYAYRKGMKIDKVIEVVVSSRKEDRGLSALDDLTKGDALIVVALDRLGRSTLQVLSLLDELSSRGIIVHIINEGLVVDSEDTNPMTKLTLTILSAFAELERGFISSRTKAALKQKKADGVTLGRPKGSTSSSQYDKDRERILELVNYGVPMSKIVEQIGYGTRQSLATYIKKISK